MTDPFLERNHPRWNEIWKATANPSFDKGNVSPALLRLIQGGTEEAPIPVGRALVPGCGRGYDVAVLASPSR